MSKKLIAVASAAALALSALVAMPTIATAAVGPFAVTADGSATNSVSRDGSTSAKSLQVNVPTADIVRFVAANNAVGTTSTTASALKFVVTTPGVTDAITVTSTGGVEVITDTVYDAGDVTTASGSQSLSDVAADGNATIYAYTTSTAAGTVVISSGGSSKTYHISGLSTFVYKIALTSSASAAISGDVTISGTAKDAFGNDLTTSVPEASWTINGLGGNLSGALTDTFTYSSTAKTYKMVVTNRSTAGPVALSVTLADSVKASAVTALGTPVQTQFFTVNAVDLDAQVTALTAQVAALTAQLNAGVTAAKYNKLAKRWNRANPTKKVALKK